MKDPLNHSTFDAIVVRKVSKHFGTQVVLRHLNLKIPQGEFVCLLGASGCGKSTVLRLLAGLEQPDVLGEEDQGLPSLELRSNPEPVGPPPRLGFVFQQANLLPWRSVRENVGLPLRLQKASRATRLAETNRSLQEVGLTLADGLKWPRMLSGGMQMRASLARALVTRPEILLLDEPFSALDEVLRQRLCEELRQWHQEFGWTTIFVTHHVSEAVFLADRILILRNLAEYPAEDSLAADLPIEFPGERTSELRESPRYVEEVVRVTKRFRELLR
ncbi:MAG: ABC transporter ATP-binding protein [Planctomycetaceae bacterium]|nr:ABC transporter ATP-binding protein [Planctomycetaceae bacterium]